MPLPRIAVIGTGGTISSLAPSRLDVLDYPEFGTKLSVEQVLERTPEAATVADVRPIPFRAVGSTAIGPADWLQLLDLRHGAIAADPALDGFVILHGTATLEETAFFLNLTLAIQQTVVLVGAQPPASALGSDGGANLVAALRVAGSPDARGLGVLVVMNDEIHTARDVVKTSTYRLQTFRSPDFGALGHVDGDGVQIFRSTRRRHAVLVMLWRPDGLLTRQPLGGRRSLFGLTLRPARAPASRLNAEDVLSSATALARVPHDQAISSDPR